MLKVDHRRSGVEVCVVVDDDESVGGGEYGGQQIGYADSPVTTVPGQRSLGVQCRVPVFVIGG